MESPSQDLLSSKTPPPPPPPPVFNIFLQPRLEAEQAALGLSQVTAEMLGISQDIWLQQINRAESTLAISSSSSGQISSSGQVSSGQISSGQISSGQISSGQISSGQISSGQISSGQISSSSSLSSALIQQILLAIQPQVAAAVQSAVGSQSSSQVTRLCSAALLLSQ